MTPTLTTRTVRALTAAVATASAALLLSACGAVGPASTEQGSDSFGPVARVEIDADSGTVQVRSGPDGAATVDRTLRWAGDRKPQVTAQMAGDVLRVGASCPDDSGDCETELVITVPAATGVRSTLGAGNVTASGLTGALDLGTGAGNVTGTALGAGPVTARTSAGNVDVGFAAAPSLVDAQSNAGNVDVRLPVGPVYDVEATTAAGNTRVQVPDTPGADSRVVARSSAGNVSVLTG